MTQELKSQTGKRENPQINSSMKQLTWIHLKDKMNRGGGLPRSSGIPVWQELQQCTSLELLLRKRGVERSYFSFLLIILSVLVCYQYLFLNKPCQKSTYTILGNTVFTGESPCNTEQKKGKEWICKQTDQRRLYGSMQIIF